MTVPACDEYWSVDDVPLHTLAWNITTFGGSRYGLPQLRGEDVTYPFTPGRVWQPKQPDARTIALQMWVRGSDPDTGRVAPNMRLAFNNNFNRLRRLLWRPQGEQFPLTRRWWLSDPDATAPQLLTATAMAALAGPMDPSMTVRSRAEITVDLLLDDPFFYGPQVSENVPVGSAAVLNPGEGIASHSGVTVDLVGPLVNPVLTNSARSPHEWVSYADTVPDGSTVRLDVANFFAYTLGSGAPQSGKVRSGGHRRWLRLWPGVNPLTLSATGTGHAVITYRPPYV